MIELTLEKRHRYSPHERELFSMLPQDGSWKSFTDIFLDYKWGKVRPGKPEPLNSRKVLGGAMRSLCKKVRLNDEPFLIMADRPKDGPNPIRYKIRKVR